MERNTSVEDKEREKQENFLRQLVSVYENPLLQLREHFSLAEQLEEQAQSERDELRFRNDRLSVILCILNQMNISFRGIESRDIFSTNLLKRAATSVFSGNMGNRSLPEIVLQVMTLLATGGSDLETGGLEEAVSKLLVESPDDLENQRLQRPVDPNSPTEKKLARLVSIVLDQIIDSEHTPRFFDFDYIDDLDAVISSRYARPGHPHNERGNIFRQVISLICTGTTDASVSHCIGEIRKILGPQQKRYLPPRAPISPAFGEVVPEYVDEFVSLKGQDNPELFLHINREYSRRQHNVNGLWDNRQLSLLRGYETDHHLLLRTILSLKRTERLKTSDEILIVGPRHIDEIQFFRSQLGMSKTYGLDLFPSADESITAGDMHNMPFESGRFKMIFCSGTLSYSYNARLVIEEMARVLSRPAFVFLIIAADKVNGPNPLGRSDMVSMEGVISSFYKHNVKVLCKNVGRSLDPTSYRRNLCLGLELD